MDLGQLKELLIYSIPGAGILAGSAYLPNNLKGVGYIAGGSLFGYGVYKFFKQKEVYPDPPPGTNIPISIVDPSPFEEWFLEAPHSIEVEVNNPLGETVTVYVGLSIRPSDAQIEAGCVPSGGKLSPDGMWIDAQLKQVNLEPYSTQRLEWWIKLSPLSCPTGWWTALTKVWRGKPYYGCTECEMLGSDILGFKYIKII